MRVCAVDGCGAGLGSRLVAGLRAQMPEGHAIVGLGLNQASAQTRARGGAMSIETQPRVIHQRVSTADLIVGSLSLLMPGAMLGEVTPELVQALLDSPARKFLLPLNRHNVEVIGSEGRTHALIEQAIRRIACVTESVA